MSEEYQIDFGTVHTTNIALGTSAERAYALYCSKMAQIENLKYECSILVDKYHDELRRAYIPAQFGEDIINDLFDKDDKKKCTFVRSFFLSQCFSDDFPKSHDIKFDSLSWHGYGRTAAGITLEIGEYLYTVEIPLPKNIVNEKDKEMLMGDVMFRVDKIHKSKKGDFCKDMEAVQMPTYDWKKCFDAIERDVDHASKKGATRSATQP